MSAPMDVSDNEPSISEAERKRLALEESKSEFSKLDAVMEPTVSAFVDQYLDVGGAPFDVMELLVQSYEGLAAMANAVDRDIRNTYGSASDQAVITESISRKIVDSFDPARADEDFGKTQQLPGYIVDMIPHKAWRRTIYRLSEQYPKSEMLSAALQKIAEEGFQAELTSLNSATLATHVFYGLLAECFEKVAPATDETLHERIRELVSTVCRTEQTYFMAQYVLACVRKRLGQQAVGLRRIEEELEAHVLDKYDRPQLAVHMRLLLDGRAVGGDDEVANALVSIIQSSYAAPGDVINLYKQYHGALVAGRPAPLAQMLRNERILMPILEQTFGHLWGATMQSQRTDLVDKYIWLLAYATLGTNGPEESMDQGQLQQLVAQMKLARDTLPVRPIQTTFNQVIRQVIEWVRVPILARVVLLWIRDVISYDDFTFYDKYFTSSEAPVPLLLLEEIAFCQPLLKPLVFDVYKESFESKVPGFIPDRQIRLQKVVINRIAALVQLDYALPVVHYFDSRAESMDQSVLAYFIFRTLAQFEPPYAEEFYQPMLQLIERAVGGIKTMKEKELMVVSEFLGCIDDARAERLAQLLPDDPAPLPSATVR
ncbi:hypothetical protein GGI20_000721 [Coemansia sp. BCRC 34301]|nr:hypothetical protein GGI20_000721 [Coemansia sp. BCRC 34301]